MMKPFEELDNGQFFENLNPRSESDRYFIKISNRYALRVRLYPSRSEFKVDRERVKIDLISMTYPLTLLKGRAYRSKMGGEVQTVAQGYGKQEKLHRKNLQ